MADVIPPAGSEQLISALIPGPLRRPDPPPAPTAMLPASLVSPQGHEVLAVARLDPSGRVPARGVLTALGWFPGRRLDIIAQRDAILVRAVDRGRGVVGGRSEISLPAAARQLCGIAPGSLVLLVALTTHDVLVIHPARTITRMLRTVHTRLLGEHHAR